MEATEFGFQHLREALPSVVDGLEAAVAAPRPEGPSALEAYQRRGFNLQFYAAFTADAGNTGADPAGCEAFLRSASLHLRAAAVLECSCLTRPLARRPCAQGGRVAGASHAALAQPAAGNPCAVCHTLALCNAVPSHHVCSAQAVLGGTLCRGSRPAARHP